MKTLITITLALLALTFAAASFAQAQDTCEMNMSMKMAHKGKDTLTVTSKYEGLTQADAQKINAQGMKVVDEASKGQNKRGDYTITFDGSNTCGITVAPLITDGLTHKDIAKVWRQSQKFTESVVQQSEAHVAKGGKGPWGKDK